MQFDYWSVGLFAEALLMVPGDLGRLWQQTEMDLHQQRPRIPVGVPRTPSGLVQMLVGYFGRNLCALLANCVGLWVSTADSNWWGWRGLVRLCWTVGGAGTGVWILNTTRRTMTIQDQRHLRLWSGLTLVMWFMLRSPLVILFSLASVLIFSVGTHFRLDLRPNCKTGVSVKHGFNFLTLNAGRCWNATCLYWTGGVRGAWMFVATAGQTTAGRGACWANGLFRIILMSFAVAEGFSGILGEFLLRFRLPAGLHHLCDALRRRRPRALRGTCIAMTFSVAVLLTGSDPVPQLPINMFCCWTGALLNKHQSFKKRNTCCDHTVYEMYLSLHRAAPWTFWRLLGGALAVWVGFRAALRVAGAARLQSSGTTATNTNIQINVPLLWFIGNVVVQTSAYHEELWRMCWDEPAADGSHFSGMTAKWKKRPISLKTNPADTFWPCCTMCNSVLRQSGIY